MLKNLPRKHQGIWDAAPRYPFLPLIHSTRALLSWALLLYTIFTKTSTLHLRQSSFYSLSVHSLWPCTALLSAHSSGQCARRILHHTPPPNLGMCPQLSLSLSHSLHCGLKSGYMTSPILEVWAFRYGKGLNVLHFPLTSFQDSRTHTLSSSSQSRI